MLAALVVAACATTPRSFPRDDAQEAQLHAIVAHMTLAQKVGQMTQADIRAITPDEVRRFYVGSVLNGGGAWPGNDKHAGLAEWRALADAFWDASMHTDMAVKIIRLAQSLVDGGKHSVTRNQLLDALWGKAGSSARGTSFHSHELFGCGKDFPRDRSERVTDRLEYMGIFRSVSKQNGEWSAAYLEVNILN